MKLWRFPATTDELETLKNDQLRELCLVINAILAYCEHGVLELPPDDDDEED